MKTKISRKFEFFLCFEIVDSEKIFENLINFDGKKNTNTGSLDFLVPS